MASYRSAQAAQFSQGTTSRNRRECHDRRDAPRLRCGLAVPAVAADRLAPSRGPRWPAGSRGRQLCFHPGQLVVHVVACGEGIQLGLKVVAAAGHGGVLQRAGGQQLTSWVRACSQLRRPVDPVPAEQPLAIRLPLMRHAGALVNPITWPEPFGVVMTETQATVTSWRPATARHLRSSTIAAPDA